MQHPNQEGQHLSKLYSDRLRNHRISISLASRGCAWENGAIERSISTLKDEELYLSDYDDFRGARQSIGDFIEDLYMHKRPHASLSYLAPAEFEAQLGRDTDESLL